MELKIPTGYAHNSEMASSSSLAGAIAQASRLKPEIRLAQAVSEFEAALSQEQKADFRTNQDQPAPADVMCLTAEIDRRICQKSGLSGRCVGPRLTNFLQATQQFAALGDVIVGGSQNLIACGVWSLVRMTLLVHFPLNDARAFPQTNSKSRPW